MPHSAAQPAIVRPSSRTIRRNTTISRRVTGAPMRRGLPRSPTRSPIGAGPTQQAAPDAGGPVISGAVEVVAAAPVSAVRPRDAAEVAEGPCHQSCDVLVVEDAGPTRRLMLRLLRRRGYHATAAASGEEAVEAVARGCRPVVALVDFDLPGMNGLDAIARLREVIPRVRPVLITAAGPDRVPTLAFLAGFADGLKRARSDADAAGGGDRSVTVEVEPQPTTYFRKPVKIEKLIRLLDAVFPDKL